MADAGKTLRQLVEEKIAQQSKAVRFTYALIRRYLDDRVGEKGAQLAYYFLFSLFPFVIFLTSAIGMTSFELTDLFQADAVIPQEVAEMLTGYMNYVRGVASPALAWTGLLLTVWFFSRATRSLQNALDLAMRVKKRRSFPVRVATSIAITVGLLASIPLGITFAFTGQTILEKVSELMPQLAGMSEWIASMRGAILITYSLILVMIIYLFGPSVRLTFKQVVPGILFAAAVWTAASAIFSYYVANMARYSALYGSLGAVLVLLLWLYITGAVIVLGGEVNGILIEMAKEEQKAEK